MKNENEKHEKKKTVIIRRVLPFLCRNITRADKNEESTCFKFKDELLNQNQALK
jgi:hypothetical protein